MKKKTLAILSVLAAAAVAFAVESTPELLKQKELFSQTELFESEAVFSNPKADADLIKDYEANPKSYADNQLLPVAVCYMGMGNLEKSRELFLKFAKVEPKNARAQRTLGTISMLEGKPVDAVDYYRKAIALGDKNSAIFASSALILNKTPEAISEFLPILRELSKTNLEALNTVLAYSVSDAKNPDLKLVGEVVSAADTRRVIGSATNDGMATLYRLFAATQDAWKGESLVLPARAAATLQLWFVASELYNKALAANPDNIIALRGMGLVLFKVGDTQGAADSIMKAYKLGDKDGALDGLELFILSRQKFVWSMFKTAILKDVKLVPQLRAALVIYAVNGSDCADMFYAGAIGDGSAPLYLDATVRKFLERGIEKYPSADAARVKKLLDSSKPAEAPASPDSAK